MSHESLALSIPKRGLQCFGTEFQYSPSKDSSQNSAKNMSDKRPLAADSFFEKFPIPDDGRTIRLVYIEAESPDDKLRLRVERYEINSSSTPHYVALSYFWGDPSARRAVLCNGIIIQVAENLYGALQRLRTTTTTTTSINGSSSINGTAANSKFRGPFWIDALCIDLSNEREKTSQVQLMGPIYSKAELVLVWLGEEDQDDIEELFDALENGIDVGDNTQLSKLNTLQGMFKEVLDPRVPAHENLLASVLGDTLPLLLDMMPGQIPIGEPSREEQRACGKILQLLHNLTRRPWFTRIWVVQEILLSRKAILMCGPHQIPWHSFCIGEKYILRTCQVDDPEQDGTLEGDKKYRLIADIAAIPIMTKSIRLQYAAKTLGTLLPYFRKCKSSDPRDKVFGMLAIASSTADLVADYGMGVVEVYAQATKKIIQENGSLAILSHTDRGPRMKNLPSWVPDWSVPLQPSRVARLQEMEELQYSASGDVKTDLCLGETLSKLVLNGLLIDSVDSILISDGSDEQLQPELRRILVRNGSNITAGEFKSVFESVSWVMRQVTQARGLSGIYRSTWEPIELAWLCTISAGNIPQEYKYTEDENEKSMLEYLSIRKPVDIEELYFQANKAIERFMSEAEIQMQGKHVVRTQTGYFALVPADTRKGDKLVVLKGGPMPFVLRPAGKEFMLLGDCYIHGAMKGEAVSGEVPAWQSFTLI